MRNMIIDGKDSILRNLPRPKVEWVDDQHTYVSVIDCFADLLAHGYEVEEIKENVVPEVRRSLAESQVGQDILLRGRRKYSLGYGECPPFRATYFYEWFDDCDPNHNKKLRGGVYVKTVTFMAPAGLHNSMAYTYVIALGPEHVDHECVEKCFLQDLKTLADEKIAFWSPKDGKLVFYHIELAATLADQLARHCKNKIMAGNGTYGAWWGYAADLSAICQGVPCCPECEKTLQDHMPLRECHECTQWNMDINHCKLNFPPPKNYPADELPSSGMLRPIKLSFESMKQAVIKSHNRVVSECWTAVEADTYLWTQGLNTKAREAIIKNAENTLVLDT